MARLAAKKKTLPLFYRGLNAATPDSIPADCLQLLKAKYCANAARSLAQIGVLREVLRVLDSAGVRAVPIEGPALAQIAYGNFRLRSFVDPDVLVRRQDLPLAKGALTLAGFAPCPGLSPAKEAVLLRTQHALAMSREDVHVELHWELVHRNYAHSLRAENVCGRRA